MTAKREELYRNVPPPGEPIPVGDLSFSADDGILENEYITWAVRRLQLNRSGAPSGMRSEHLRQWLIAAMQDNLPDTTNWMKVFVILEAEFRDGTLAEECTWQTVVLIPKRKG